jgi:hypothetical protein
VTFVSRLAGLAAAAAVVGVIVHVRRDMATRGVPLSRALADLPAALRRELRGIPADARLALSDGRAAAGERRRMLEAQLAEIG